MIAITEASTVALIVAVIGAAGLGMAAIFTAWIAHSIRTGNGKTLGVLVTHIAEQVQRIERKLEHHFKDPDAHDDVE